jgi:hemerythrin
MALIWTDDLAVGFGRIDTQHQELFLRYNRLIEACRDGKGREQIATMLDFMIEYVTTHFAEEERFMTLYRYPEREAHQKEHRELFAHVQQVREELHERGPTVGVITSITHTLLHWLIRHVKQTDIELARFLVANAA